MLQIVIGFFVAITMVFPASANAQAASVDYHAVRAGNIRIFCMGYDKALKNMADILNTSNITSEEQVYNNASLWNTKGCVNYLTPAQVVLTERVDACRAKAPNCHEVGFVGWILTDDGKWLTPIQRVAIINTETGVVFLAWQPAGIYSRLSKNGGPSWDLPEQCKMHFRTVGGVVISGHQFDGFGQRYCSRPILRPEPGADQGFRDHRHGGQRGYVEPYPYRR